MNPSPIGGDPGAPQDTTRLIITALMLVSLYGLWSFFFAPTPPPVPTADAGVEGVEGAPKTGEKTAAGAKKPGEGKAEPGAEGAAAPPKGGTPPQPERRVTVEAKVASAAGQQIKTIEGGYRAVVSNQGGQLESFVLTGYDDTSDPDAETGKLHRYDLVSDVDGAMLGLQSRGGEVEVATDDPYELVAHEGNRVALRRQTAEGVRISRVYDFDVGRYGFTHALTLKNESAETRVVALDVVMQSAYAPPGGSFFAPQASGDVAHCRTTEEHEGWDVEDLKEDGPASVPGNIGYLSSSDHYFISALLPVEPTSTSGCTVSFYKPKAAPKAGEVADDGVAAHLELVSLSLKPGESRTLVQKGYFGPKQLQLLEQEGRSLDETIEFGIFGILSKPILWVLVKLYNLVGNFGWAIILLTFLIKLLTFPLTQKSYVSMQQMKTLAPELKKLQEKYGHDRATMGQKQMELYKEKGINPLAGCFPMLVQMPIWFALYRTLWTSVELYQKPFIAWITDLSQPDQFPGLGFPVLPFLVGALMLAQTAMQPPPQEQPQMKYVLWAMPIMFTVFMFGMPAGLSIYMITNSTLTFAQQLYIKRKYAVPDADESK